MGSLATRKKDRGKESKAENPKEKGRGLAEFRIQRDSKDRKAPKGARKWGREGEGEDGRKNGLTSPPFKKEHQSKKKVSNLLSNIPTTLIALKNGTFSRPRREKSGYKAPRNCRSPNR